MSVQNTDHALFVLQEYRKAIATNGRVPGGSLIATVNS